MSELNPVVKQVTERIVKRSQANRQNYLERMHQAMESSVQRSQLTCGNMAHACAAATVKEKQFYATDQAANLGIVTAYNDMLSAHQPFKDFPDQIKQTALSCGATAQVAGAVPAMCDGVTQGQSGMELSLFSRDVIALSASVALSHQCFDAVVYLGICDKIIPGLSIAAASFGHVPAMMLPAGPMPSGIPNEEKALVRQRYAAGEANKKQLLDVEMGSYHSPGTCTFFGTANTNQLIMEIMGLHLPGASFVNPNTPLRDALTRQGVERSLELVSGQKDFTPACEIFSEKNFVNGLVGLLASGGSTNLVIHLVAMAKAAGISIVLEDFSDLSSAVPMISRVYPNGWADVNTFQAAGGMALFIRELLQAGLLHNEVKTVVGTQLSDYIRVPQLNKAGKVDWVDAPAESANDGVLTTVDKAFSATGGLTLLQGNLGRAIVKTSALKPEQRKVHAPARVFYTQAQVKEAFEAGELNCDFVCVLCFQGPQANGMPELHALTPILSAIQAKGYQVALVTDGRMSGASGKIPAAIHVSPEALAGGAIAKVCDGDLIMVNADSGELTVEAADLIERDAVIPDMSHYQQGCGRELFTGFRDRVAAAEDGGSVLF
ncbi:MAG: phosphogluconate dehydratase [Arenicella sp.]